MRAKDDSRLAPAGGLKLEDSALLREQCYVNGAWLDAPGGATLPVHNPATGALLGTVPAFDAASTEKAVSAAHAAFPAWAAKTAKERSILLRRWHDLILLNAADLAQLMTAEQGKPLAESSGEIAYAASFVEWFAEEAKRVYGDVIPGHQPDKRILVLRQPVGVVAAITPWNFPAAMITRKVAPALAAGCTVVIKPATQTPYSALALAELAARAGIPAGVFNVVTGPAREIGGELTGDPRVRKLSFTGSTEIGKLLMAQCARTMKKVSLELGGNAPFIVFDDADLDAAVAGAIASKYRNTGQTCVCANRLLVQEGVYEAFAQKLVAAVQKLRVGDGLAGETEQGPLIDDGRGQEGRRAHRGRDGQGRAGRDRRQAPRARRHVLRADGAHGRHARDGGCARGDLRSGRAAVPFHDGSRKPSRWRTTPSSVSRPTSTRATSRVPGASSEALEYGIVGLNTGLISTEVAPFGGVKESGTGREGSKYGLLDYTEIKYLCIGGVTP